jgi:hypothetical protein
VFAAPGAPGGERALYEDEGEGYGDGARRAVAVSAAPEAVTVRVGAREGGYAPPRERVELELRGLASPASVRVDGAPHEAWREEDGAVVVELAERPQATEVEVATG